MQTNRKFNLILLVLFLGTLSTISAQNEVKPLYVDLGISAGVGSSASVSLYGMKGFLQNEKLQVGLGLRVFGFMATHLNYTSAPPRLADNPALTDTLRMQQSRVGSVNLAIFAKYTFLPKWRAGFNLDLAGVGFGGESDAEFISENRGGRPAQQQASPTALNVLLVDVRDRVSLNRSFLWNMQSIPLGLFGWVLISHSPNTAHPNINRKQRPIPIYC